MRTPEDWVVAAKAVAARAVKVVAARAAVKAVAAKVAVELVVVM
jgi:hypothetical protein